jgi:hypothetical protein
VIVAVDGLPIEPAAEGKNPDDPDNAYAHEPKCGMTHYMGRIRKQRM